MSYAWTEWYECRLMHQQLLDPPQGRAVQRQALEATRQAICKDKL